MSNTELATTNIADSFMPVMDIDEVMKRHAQLSKFKELVLKPDVDYGVIPGTTKPTLFKPGAEKLCTLFGLSSHFEVVRIIEDWTGKDFDGEPMFYYTYRCTLSRGDMKIADAEGSCNSREVKYRYRNSQRKCPDCQQETLFKSKPPKKGYYCWAKKGGCGAQFNDGDPRIENQETGKVPNPDIAELVNTIQKMAQKRAAVAATLLAVNASEFFTQDMEDFSHGDNAPEPQQATPAPPQAPAKPVPDPAIKDAGRLVISKARQLWGDNFRGELASEIGQKNLEGLTLASLQDIVARLDTMLEAPLESETAEAMGDDGSKPIDPLCDSAKYMAKYFAIAEGTAYKEAAGRASFVKDATQGAFDSLAKFLNQATTPEAQKLMKDLQSRITAEAGEFSDPDENPFSDEEAAAA